MKSHNLTLRILNNTKFSVAYEEFLLDRNMNRSKYLYILAIATLLINSSNENVKKLGYRIIVIYCNRTSNYKPLYDIAVNSGLVPVTQYIEDNLILEIDKNVFTEINAALNSNYIINNIFCSFQQMELIEFYNDNHSNSMSIVAPTSYGKTDLIVHTISNNPKRNICVITPTKSLLAQTRTRIYQSSIDKKIKIITHPEMFNGKEDNIIAVMTQERVLRLLRDLENIKFDYVIIDEAHGLLHDDDRNLLLASVILILEKRNPDTIFKFLTPFLCDANNIKVRYANFKLKTYVVDEYIKTEKIFIVELREKYEKGLYLYDQFVNKFLFLEEVNYKSEWTFIEMYSGSKNIIYFNKPKDIENFSRVMQEKSEYIFSDKIEKICKNIAEYIHPKYTLIDSIKKGVIYHHGAVPEPIRMYIEKVYSEIEEIRFVVTSSTLLEGVNLPADKMFILDNKKGVSNLSPSDFKNLIGRICRFSQIFNNENGSLKRLEPEIYLVAGKYYSSNANIINFLKNSMYIEKLIEDDVRNVMLEKTEINTKNQNEFNNAKEFLENYEGQIIKDYELRKVKTNVGKACFMNNITEFDIFAFEEIIEITANKIKEEVNEISNTDTLFKALNDMFFCRISNDIMKRFNYIETRNFYKMFLDWRISNTSLKQMVTSFIKYWEGILERKEKNTLVYVGRWGDETRDGVIPLWTDISKKSIDELINLAIVRVKEEQDFLDNILLKYIEVLYDLEMLNESLYLCIKYGTDNMSIITCTRNGLSLGLAKLIVDQYSQYVEIDVANDTISFREEIINAMQKANENEIMVYELMSFL